MTQPEIDRTASTLRENLMKLAERVEGAAGWQNSHAGLTAEVLAAFGIDAKLYHRAGWKIIYPDSGRPGSMLWPTSNIADFILMMRTANAPIPEMIHSDPRLATAAALRDRAQAGEA